MTRRAWYEGSSNPLDQRGNDPRVNLLGQRADPRSLENGLARQQIAAAEIEFPDADPLQILIDREEDENRAAG